jgi:hypothetical protein
VQLRQKRDEDTAGRGERDTASLTESRREETRLADRK